MPQPGVFDIAPTVAGSRPTLRALAGALHDDVRAAPTFAGPGREYHLLTGPVEAASESVEEEPLSRRSPNLWWPNDRAWCVATEIDLNSTYLGCSAACRDDLLALPLEAFAIDPATGITNVSDLRNHAAK